MNRRHKHCVVQRNLGTHSGVLDVLEINIIHRENLITFLKTCPVCIRVRDHLTANTHRHTQQESVTSLSKYPPTHTHTHTQRSTLRHLGYEDAQLWRLATADVEAQLCPWWLLQHDGTREELGELVVVVRVMNSLARSHKKKANEFNRLRFWQVQE